MRNHFRMKRERMKKYNREEQSGSDTSSYRHRSPRVFKEKREKSYTPPGYLNEYEKSVWFLNSFNGSGVKRRDIDSNESMIRRFKRNVENSGILKELKRREYYLSPSEKVRDKKKRALKRLRKQLKIEEQFQSGRDDK